VRWTSRHTDPETGVVITRACIQVYRVERGKFAETWVAMQNPGAWEEYESVE
jgi:hypothetical protein